MTDAYHKFLGIPPEEQPPHHYRLLAIALFEDNPEVISNAARFRCQYLRSVSLQRPDITEPLLNEVMRAKHCLLEPRARAEYDRRLKEELAARRLPSPPPDVDSRSTAPESKAASLLDDAEAASSFASESWQIAPPTPPIDRPKEWVVGSGSHAAIRVRARWVSRRHCRIWDADGETWIEDLGSTNGTFVNDARLTGPVRLSDGDLVTLGRKTRLPWPLPTGCAGRDLRVYLIGRSPDCDYEIEEKSVSQHHAQLLVEGEAVYLQDLDSLNGTRVGSLDQRVQAWCELPGHVSIYFGAYKVFAQELLQSVGAR